MRQTFLFLCKIGFTCGLLSGNARCDEPTELSRLRSQWFTARTNAVLPIDKKYNQELEDLKTRFTKAGNLEAGLAVNAELKLTRDAGISPNPSASPELQSKPKPPTGSWKGLWQTRLSHTITFDQNGKVTYSDDTEAWASQYRDSGWIVKRENKQKETVYLDRYTVVGDRMYLEQWYPINLFEEGRPPSSFGIATKVK